jgi:hypothetical protein
MQRAAVAESDVTVRTIAPRRRLIHPHAHFTTLEWSHQSLLRKSKLKLYWTLIRPIVTCADETRVLKENSLQNLMIF